MMKILLYEIQIRLIYYSNREILYFRRNVKPKKIGNILFYVFIPYYIIKLLLCKLYELSFGYWYVRKQIKADKKKKYSHELAIASIAKNEGGGYLKEWIEYHRIVGVTKFYFYDNESTDNTYEILKPYIESGIVVYKFVEGKGKQLDVYNDVVNKYKFESRYIAFIDLDEYIFPMNDSRSLVDTIHQLFSSKSNAAGLGLNWSIFGSSGLKHTQTSLTQSFLRRADSTFWCNHHIKTLCNPRFVTQYISPHYPLYKLGAYSISEGNGQRLYAWACRKLTWKNIRLNHYYCKSYEDYIRKVSRGLGDRIGNYDMSKLKVYDRNEVLDAGMKRYSEEIKKALGI